MITPTEAGHLAEMIITAYAKSCEVETPEDVRRAMEMLISKASLVIERHTGRDDALSVLGRTFVNLEGMGAKQNG